MRLDIIIGRKIRVLTKITLCLYLSCPSISQTDIVTLSIGTKDHAARVGEITFEKELRYSYQLHPMRNCSSVTVLISSTFRNFFDFLPSFHHSKLICDNLWKPLTNSQNKIAVLSYHIHYPVASTHRGFDQPC